MLGPRMRREGQHWFGRGPLERVARSRLAGLLVAGGLTLGLLAASGTAAAATTWNATAGAENNDQSIQVLQFLPDDISINVGDSIIWTTPTGEPHTITFLGDSPRPGNIAAPVGGSTFDGHTQVSSGFKSDGQTYTLTFTSTGDFELICLLHPEMVGTVHVAPEGTRYPHSQAYYDRVSTASEKKFLAQGQKFLAQGAAASVGGGNRVTAESGDGKVAVMRFQPESRTLRLLEQRMTNTTLRVGDTITWTNLDSETPHTVTFGTLQGSPATPSGLDGTGHATIGSTSDSVNSGFIGQNFGSKTFSVTFAAPGTYDYICALHDEIGMVGTIVVR